LNVFTLIPRCVANVGASPLGLTGDNCAPAPKGDAALLRMSHVKRKSFELAICSMRVLYAAHVIGVVAPFNVTCVNNE
jgi:hypothetical protein